jgi:hypothetical protein
MNTHPKGLGKSGFGLGWVRRDLFDSVKECKEEMMRLTKYSNRSDGSFIAWECRPLGENKE